MHFIDNSFADFSIFIMAESDLERFKRQQNIVTDESLESTRRMVNMVEESQTAGKVWIALICHIPLFAII